MFYPNRTQKKYKNDDIKVKIYRITLSRVENTIEVLFIIK